MFYGSAAPDSRKDDFFLRHGRRLIARLKQTDEKANSDGHILNSCGHILNSGVISLTRVAIFLTRTPVFSTRAAYL